VPSRGLGQCGGGPGPRILSARPTAAVSPLRHCENQRVDDRPLGSGLVQPLINGCLAAGQANWTARLEDQTRFGAGP